MDTTAPKSGDGAEGPVVLFDGACNLCARGVRFVLARERPAGIGGRLLRFGSLQSDFARGELIRRGMDPDDLDTMVVLDGERTLTRSDGVLFVAGYLRRPWRWARWLGVLPRGVRDWMYGLVARSRYRVFGKRDECMVPTPEARARFVDSN